MNAHGAKERRSLIISLLKEQQKVSVEELSARFQVSEVSIRKDLEELDRRNLLKRIRGGAIKMPEINQGAESTLGTKRLSHFREKISIGKAAASLIHEDETIILDSGTTTMEIAKNLNQFRNLTIVTNALDIAMEVSKYGRFNVIVLGGYVRGAVLSTVGHLAENALKIFYSDKLFLGVDSFSLDKGVSTFNIEEASLNQSMIGRAKEVIAVFDSSKFERSNFVFIAPASQINTIITDNGISQSMKRELKKIGINLIITAPAND